jgi:protein-tyrosine kinase
MTSKLPNLAERAAAQLSTQPGRVGTLDSSVQRLLGQQATARSTETSEQPVPQNTGVTSALQQLGQPKAVDPHTASSPDTTDTGEAGVSAPAIIRAPGRRIEMAALERAGMIDWEQARSRISEEFRIIQRQVLRNSIAPDVVEQGSANLVMLTSSRPGEGKSFVSLNLAAGIARQQDHDVLLVDIDYKQDSICSALGLAGARGLLDLVTDPTLDPDDVIVKTELKNLSILPIGLHGERSPELFASRQATRTIQSLGRRYSDRLVVLDSPPCLATSEPGVLASIVGQIVLVVEAEKTQREEVEAAMDLIHTCPTITLLLNKAQISTRYTFGTYSSSYSQPYTS